MPGCWYNVKTKQVISAPRCHACAVMDNPSLFGMTKDDLEVLLGRGPALRSAKNEEERKDIIKKFYEDAEHASQEDLHPLWEALYDKGFIRMHSLGSPFEGKQVWATSNSKELMQKLAGQMSVAFEKHVHMLFLDYGSDKVHIYNGNQAEYFAKHGVVPRKK